MQAEIEHVRNHWEDETCGVRTTSETDHRRRALEIERIRYELIPEIPGFAQFERSRGKTVLEIGVGAGTDFRQWVKAGANAYGVDLTEAAINITMAGLTALGLAVEPSKLRVVNAEHLPFGTNTFDVVYSWGVLHHSPDTAKAFSEAHRVLCPGGQLIAMIYHRHSWMALLYWIRFALLTGRLRQSLSDVISKHMESPHTSIYSIPEALQMLSKVGFRSIEITPRLMQGDLFDFPISDRYDGTLIRVAQKLFPRWLVRSFGHRYGGMLMIKAVKS